MHARRRVALVIYDCFTFFNELDLLEIRLHVLSESVDRFVLVESTQTFQGEPKPLYFAEHRERFRDFADRIEHVVVEDLGAPGVRPFAREVAQRDAIARGLTGAGPGDVVLISDVDEIPHPRAIAAHRHARQPHVLRQWLFYYYLNVLVRGPDRQQNATVLVPYESLPASVQRLRYLVHLRGWRGDTLKGRVHGALARARRPIERSARFVPDAGWHFSFLGGVAAIVEKIEAFSHDEYNDAAYKTPERIAEAIARGADLFGRDQQFETVALDDRLPAWLRENADRYPHLLAPVPAGVR